MLLFELFFMLCQLNLLETLTYPTVQFNEFVKTVFRAAYFSFRDFTICEIVYTIHETHFRYFVIVENKVFELFYVRVWSSGGHILISAGILSFTKLLIQIEIRNKRRVNVEGLLASKRVTCFLLTNYFIDTIDVFGENLKRE